MRNSQAKVIVVEGITDTDSIKRGKEDALPTILFNIAFQGAT